MQMPTRRASWLAALAVLAFAAATAGIVYALGRSSSSGAVSSSGSGAAGTTAGANLGTAAGATTVAVEKATVGRPIPAGFLGLTTEYRGREAYAGPNPQALDPVFEQLIRNLAPGQRPVLRIGGDSTDWTWWPVHGTVQPLGVKFSLTEGWVGVARALAQALNARLLLGINFEADSARIAATEAKALIGGIGAKRIEALELGNEPELYAAFPWYKLPNGHHVRGRPPTYSYTDFVHDFGNVARALPGGVTLAGPSMGASDWIPLLGQFLSVNPEVRLATLHRYPLKHCSGTPVTVPEVLSNTSSTGLAATVAHAVGVSHARGVLLRVDEMSAISCGGMRGVSHSFATALWALDTMFAMARVGVDGVNIQTAPDSFNDLFTVTDVKGAWRAAVHPAYYGLMMFAQAAPPGSRLLRIAGAPGGNVDVWATRAPGGQVRVVLINDATAGQRVVAVRIPATGATATLVRLQAPSAGAQGGVTLGGQGMGSQTATGLLAGLPQATTVSATGGRYVVSLPPASAAMLTIAAG
jgi:hypothetical protein